MATAAPAASPTWGDHLRGILANFDDQRVRSDVTAMQAMVRDLRAIVSRCCEGEAAPAAASANVRQPPPPPRGVAAEAGAGAGAGAPLPTEEEEYNYGTAQGERPGCEGITPEDCQNATGRVRWENEHPSRYSTRYAQNGGYRKKTRKNTKKRVVYPDLPLGSKGLPPRPWGSKGLPPQPWGSKGLPPQPWGSKGLPPQPWGSKGPRKVKHSRRRKA
jgi:hypothetical protein